MRIKNSQKKSLGMPPEKALCRLKDVGYDFGEEDVVEMGRILSDYIHNIESSDELTEEQLSDIAGGGHVQCYLEGLGLGGAAIVAGILIGVGAISW